METSIFTVQKKENLPLKHRPETHRENKAEKYTMYASVTMATGHSGHIEDLLKKASLAVLFPAHPKSRDTDCRRSARAAHEHEEKQRTPLSSSTHATMLMVDFKATAQHLQLPHCRYEVTLADSRTGYGTGRVSTVGLRGLSLSKQTGKHV